MALIRQGSRRNFSCIPNHLAQDNTLSLGARGLLLYFLSLPDDWKIYVSHLQKVMIEKRKAILSLLKELRKKGYVHFVKIGYRGGWEYFVFDAPMQADELKKFLRTIPLENSSTVGQFQEDHLHNTNIYTRETREREEEPSPPPFSEMKRNTKEPSKREEAPPPPCPEVKRNPVKLGRHVELAYDEFAELCDEFGKSKIEKVATDLDDYMQSTGKKYKGYAATIRRWIRKDAQEHRLNAPQSSILENTSLGKAVEKESNEANLRGVIIELGRHFEIVNLGQGPNFVLEFSDPRFREKLVERLKKMNVKFRCLDDD